MAARSVAEISDADLVRRVMNNLAPRQVGVRRPRWAVVRDTFALGSNFSAELCRRHGLDPDEILEGPACEVCSSVEEEREEEEPPVYLPPRGSLEAFRDAWDSFFNTVALSRLRAPPR